MEAERNINHCSIMVKDISGLLLSRQVVSPLVIQAELILEGKNIVDIYEPYPGTMVIIVI